MSCTKPYNPKVIASANNYLVVEGTINTGGDSTIIKLSRTVNLNAATTTNPVTDATVAIQDDQNVSYSLQSLNNGYYTNPILNLVNTRKYRLSVTTSDGKIYLSDYVTPIASPPIDSIGFNAGSNKQQGAGVQIYLNTHDPNNNTHYYRWDYVETWQFNAKYESQYISDGTQIIARTPAQNIYSCYGNSISNNILLGSSAKLSQDVISQAPITFIPSTSEKIEQRYSINIKQYALSADAYNYFALLKQNTEDLGSIFDAQPAQLTGNIHCTTDATLPVIGYISAGAVQQKRIYINETQLPVAWTPTYPYDCELDSAYFSAPKSGVNEVQIYLIPLPNSSIPAVQFFKGGPAPAGYLYSDVDCVDCTIRGTVTKPGFWQN
ncbi:DUF4249 domain-containing protein [Mucilaginibacter sp. L196]|uniref:DUF4249 domain-containing protein n=1 Tax=Mucilaginibacter sp. L196 TaxID=1641870 RepID=UPI001C203086|nr:DUF4249 domain-containing protein [Mucilaginibacter sp. L196]